VNTDILKGNWKQVKGQLKEWWGQLTDDDLDRIEGSSEKLIGRLQERYGWTRERAEEEIDRRLAKGATDPPAGTVRT
jgi:uncharacterized protein YjbJ (UPF0337 family)